jgi:hypothetical protein
MGLFVGLSIFLAPCVLVEMIGNDSLPAFIDMHVLDRLHAPIG